MLSRETEALPSYDKLSSTNSVNEYAMMSSSTMPLSEQPSSSSLLLTLYESLEQLHSYIASTQRANGLLQNNSVRRNGRTVCLDTAVLTSYRYYKQPTPISDLALRWGYFLRGFIYYLSVLLSVSLYRYYCFYYYIINLFVFVGG